MAETDLTKLVANRLTNARATEQALEVHAVAAAPALSAVLFPDGEPRHLTVATFVAALGPAIARVADAMAAAERRLVDEYNDDVPVRDARDRSRAELRAELVSVGNSVAGAYGDEARGRYHLDVALPTDDQRLLDHAQMVHAALQRGAPKTTAKKGRTLDFHQLAAEIHPLYLQFGKSLEDVKREEREGEQAHTARDAAIAAFEPVYTGIADIAAGMLELVGQSEHAARVKPTQRRRSGLDPAPAPTDAAGDAGKKTE